MDEDGFPDLAAGGACAWRLPADERGPEMARSLLQRTMAGLRLDREVVEDGRLGVSETATNALRHAGAGLGHHATVPPELWIWARTVPSPQLVVSLFDGARTALPHASRAGLLDEHGKGLALLGEFTAAWGSAPSRSRLAGRPVPGKTVWFALPLPDTWPGLTLKVEPDIVARCLLRALTSRGICGRRNTDERGTSVLQFPGLNVWVCPGYFSWQTGPHHCVRHPLIDLQETAEHLVRHLDGSPSPSPSLAP
jgi:hypothetical protein